MLLSVIQCLASIKIMYLRIYVVLEGFFPLLYTVHCINLPQLYLSIPPLVDIWVVYEKLASKHVSWYSCARISLGSGIPGS